MSDEYDVSQYTEDQLFNILNVHNPTDRELEAKIISMIRKYQHFGNESGNKLTQFFEDIYDYFFEEEDDDDGKIEGFGPIEITGNIGNVETQSLTGNIFNMDNKSTWGDITAPNWAENSMNYAGTLNNNAQLKNTGMLVNSNMESYVKPAPDNLQLTRPLDYSKDNLNPLLKQTIKRIISIDSQYRDRPSVTSASNFTFNLSEPLKDVVSMSLYSIQIPYTWYTINSDYGGNFIYLKGNSPGITNGTHDYKISITAGNYTPDGLELAVNTGIQMAMLEYPDVSFGNTKIIYNDGLKSSSNGTGKCSLQIDITKSFNESNYTLKFPNWSSPLTTEEEPNPRLTTIAGYLGFNEQSYYCSSIRSNFINATRLNNVNELLSSFTTNITSFKIVPYIGSNYLFSEVKYSPITVDLSDQSLIISQISRNLMVNLLNTKMSANLNFDSGHYTTFCEWKDVSNNLKQGGDESYITLNCKLKDSIFPGVPNVKLAAVFENDASGSIFYGPNSVFCFSSATTDSSGNVICEFNEVLAETEILQSAYTASGDYLLFECSANQYSANTNNNYKIEIPNKEEYKLNSYVDVINSEIQKIPQLRLSNIAIDSSGVVNIKTIINNSFTNKEYTISASGEFRNWFVDLSSISIPILPTYESKEFTETFRLDPGNDTITIKPVGSGNTNTSAFVITFKEIVNDNGTFVAASLQRDILSYIDPNTRTQPFLASTITYDVSDRKFKFNLRVNINLTQNSYKLRLHSLVSNSFWDSLQFDTLYNLTDYADNNYTISSKVPATGNEITLYDGCNNEFTIDVNKNVDGLQTSTNLYGISIKILAEPEPTGTTYTVRELINEINRQLSENAISNGSKAEIISTLIGQYIKFSFNIRKVFTTKDYKLVFYDPYSFATCSSSFRSGTNSAQNATWDSTLGWILGYRNAIEYEMNNYIGVKYPSTGVKPNDNIYYFSDKPNVFVIYGDTTVSTNLYNYFLIMLDDYVQNHLNDGLVTITSQETNTDPGPYVYTCDPTGERIVVPANYDSPGITYSQAELYAFNEKVKSQMAKTRSYSNGPFVQDIFGIIPVKTSGMAIGSVYVEFGGSLQLQQRVYFGPVNIHRMTIRLLNDRGNMVDLNGANWSFSLVCEQMYKSGIN